MADDTHTKELFAQAMSMAALAARDAKPTSAFLGTIDLARLACAQITATATIFAALVEHDLANQIRAARAEQPPASPSEWARLHARLEPKE